MKWQRLKSTSSLVDHSPNQSVIWVTSSRDIDRGRGFRAQPEVSLHACLSNLLPRTGDRPRLCTLYSDRNALPLGVSQSVDGQHSNTARCQSPRIVIWSLA